MRNAVENRAQIIFDFLVENLGVGFTLEELCLELNFSDNYRTRAAIKRAREIARSEGLHFPTAVPATGFVYLVTDNPSDAIDPYLHTARIERGVRLRKEDSEEFLEKKTRYVDPVDKPFVTRIIRLGKIRKNAIAEIDQEVDDAIADIIDSRREARNKD